MSKNSAGINVSASGSDGAPGAPGADGADGKTILYATAIGASAVVLTTKQWADSHTTTLSPSYPSKTTFPKMP